MEPNTRAVIGNNSLSLDQAKARLETSGFMLARLETLAMAVRDDRIDRGCLKVLVELIDSMNRETWTSCLGRDSLAERIGITVKSAGNYIYQLKALGYIVGEKRETPQANNRVLMHYTLSALSPEELEAAITRAIGSIRGEVDTVVALKSARQDGQYSDKVPTRAGNKVPVRTGNARGGGQKSARQDGSSNITNISSSLPTSNSRTSGEKPPEPQKPRAARLNADWTLVRSWGVWAIEHFVITPDQVRSEAASFKDYWLGRSDRGAAKLDWEATWRNWIRNSRAKYRVRKPEAAAAPDLLTPKNERQRQEREADEARIAAQGWVIPNQGVTRE